MAVNGPGVKSAGDVESATTTASGDNASNVEELKSVSITVSAINARIASVLKFASTNVSAAGVRSVEGLKCASMGGGVRVARSVAGLKSASMGAAVLAVRIVEGLKYASTSIFGVGVSGVQPSEKLGRGEGEPQGARARFVSLPKPLFTVVCSQTSCKSYKSPFCFERYCRARASFFPRVLLPSPRPCRRQR